MILQEADFLRVSLKTMTQTANNTPVKEPSTKQTPSNSESAMPTNQEDDTTHKAWGDLLLSRLAENRKLSGEAKKPELAITTAFFEEYFKAVWGASIGALLITFGDLLSNDIQKLGFDRNTNPLLAFISQKYVSENLIATKHLNATTYKALHNAIANKLLAHSEMRSKRNYNIIYCRSFYNHRPADMLDYLRLQAAILRLDASNYTIEMQKQARQAFLLLPSNKGTTVDEIVEKQMTTEIKRLPHTLDPKAKLNKKAVVEAILERLGKRQKRESEPPVATETDIDKITQTLFDKPAEQLALMQYLLMTTDAKEEIKSFLMQDKFKKIDTDTFIKASEKVRAILKSIKLTESSIKQLIKALSKEGVPA